MNIKDFLIDNYIWIIFIIIITIITIIGFLADKKRVKNKAESPAQPNQNNMAPNNMEQMLYQTPVNEMQNENNNMGMNNNVNVNQPQQPMNSFVQPNQNMINNQEIGQVNAKAMSSDNNSVNNLQPFGYSNPSASAEAIYQPLSDQKPNIAPHPVPDYTNSQNIITPVDNNVNQNSSSTIPMGVPSQNNHQPIPNQTLNNSMNNNIMGGMSGFNQNNTTIPNPVNQVPVPQPVNPQPIMQNNNMDMLNSNNYNVNQNSNSTIPMGIPSQNNNQPIPMQNPMNTNMGMNSDAVLTGSPQTNPNLQSPVNFIFGPQNNNQNM